MRKVGLGAYTYPARYHIDVLLLFTCENGFPNPFQERTYLVCCSCRKSADPIISALMVLCEQWCSFSGYRSGFEGTICSDCVKGEAQGLSGHGLCTGIGVEEMLGSRRTTCLRRSCKVLESTVPPAQWHSGLLRSVSFAWHLVRDGTSCCCEISRKRLWAGKWALRSGDSTKSCSLICSHFGTVVMCQVQCSAWQGGKLGPVLGELYHNVPWLL